MEGIFMHTLSRLQSPQDGAGSCHNNDSNSSCGSNNSCDSNSSSSLFGRASRYLIPASSGDLTASPADLETLKLLFSETLDILDSEVPVEKLKIRAILRIRDPVLFYPLDPGPGAGMNFFPDPRSF
jgi:hypothetical protein